MNSCNSGSLQSSSGGDEEYDSRSESISAFFNSTTTPTGGPAVASFTNHHQPPHFFIDTLSYLDPNPNPNPNPNPLFNFDIPWTPITAGLINLPPVQQSSAPALDQSTTIPSAAAAAVAPRSSKKRSRASRRAPTTVLTTDTSNFRAMVQEFTGIPAPPFAAASSSSPFARSRFRSSSAAFMDTALPYLLRPFAQKSQLPPFSSSAAAAATNVTSSPNTCIPTTNNYQLLQSLLQSPHTQKCSLPTMPANYSASLTASAGMNAAGWTDIRSELAERASGAVGNYGNSQQANNICKMNYSAPVSSDQFQADKGSETAPAARGGGMMEPWICSSD